LEQNTGSTKDNGTTLGNFSQTVDLKNSQLHGDHRKCC